MDSTARMRDLIAVAGRLITVIREETRLLESFQTNRLGSLQDEKRRLATAYVDLIHEMRREPEVLAAIDKAVRDELADILTQFNEAATANERALNAARTANEFVIRAIADAVAAQRPATGAYSRAGTVATPNRTTATPVSVALDARF
ncbi:MAG TPA: hypothetical protein VF342_07915 [Alphaproteobacteria bacterium]